MICLTGDLHHDSLKTGNQRHCDLGEIAVARRYLERLARADVKVTFFISGRSFDEQWDDDLQAIARHPLVELGGHNYCCFTPVLLHRVFNKLGSYPGPRWYERRDVLRTIDAIQRRTGTRIRSWRNHMYKRGPHTDGVLAECGIEVCSDRVSATAAGPARGATGLLDLPINVMPDHEHLYHAERTPEYVEWFVRRYGWTDDFGPESYHVEEWTERVLDQLRANEARGAISTLIVHPITLYLCDRLRSFERILDFVAGCETVHVSELAARAAERAA